MSVFILKCTEELTRDTYFEKSSSKKLFFFNEDFFYSTYTHFGVVFRSGNFKTPLKLSA